LCFKKEEVSIHDKPVQPNRKTQYYVENLSTSTEIKLQVTYKIHFR
jgi:hypothetical protein